MRPRISITGSVRPSVGLLVSRSVRRLVGHAFVKNKGNQYFWANIWQRKYTRFTRCISIFIGRLSLHRSVSPFISLSIKSRHHTIITSSWGRIVGLMGLVHVTLWKVAISFDKANQGWRGVFLLLFEHPYGLVFVYVTVLTNYCRLINFRIHLWCYFWSTVVTSVCMMS